MQDLRQSLLWVRLCSILAPISQAFGGTESLVIYKKSSSGGGADSTAGILRCGTKFMDLEYGAFRECDSGKICEDLPFEWLLNRSYQAGCVYMEKTKTTMFDPPLTDHPGENRVYFVTRLPGPFKVGSAIKISFTPADTTKLFVCDLLHETKNGLIAFHLTIYSFAAIMDSMLDGRWQGAERYDSARFVANRKHTLTLRMMPDDVIGLEADGDYYTSFNTTGRVPVAEIRKLRVNTFTGKGPAPVHSISFLSE